MPWLSSAALAHWRRAPQAEGLRINLDRQIEQFWTLAARDPSIKLERFLVELASRIRKGEADARERMLAARARVLITVEAAADWRREGEGPFDDHLKTDDEKDATECDKRRSRTLAAPRHCASEGERWKRRWREKR